MKRNCLLPIIAAIGISFGGLGPVYADDDDGGGAVNSTVFVQTVVPAEKTLPRQMTTYGTVLPDIRNSVHIVLPRPGQVTKLAVSPGEQVRGGQKLFEFTTGSAAVLAYQQAVTALSFAKADLARNQELFSEKLATKTQLATSERALADAQRAMQAQDKTGAGNSTQWIVAPSDAVVTEITANVGERMDRGAGIMQLTQRGAVQIHLGIEPERLGEVHPGMHVALTSVFGESHPVSGQIDQLHAMINPQTRLVDAIVRLDGAAAGSLLPGMQVKGTITLSTVKSWVVPRQAVLSDAHGAYVFQVKDGKAVRVDVKQVLDMDDIYGVEGPLDSKAPLVTLGNYGLKAGQVIRNTELSASAPAGKAEAD